MTLIYNRSQIDSFYPKNQYDFFWCYSNRLVIRERDLKPYFTFFVKTDDFHYKLILKTKDFELGKEVSKAFWDPIPEDWDVKKKVFDKNQFKNEALDQIETMILSKLKKNQGIDDFQKSDFSFVYYGTGKWHAYYPPLNVLENRYKEKQANIELNTDKYISFITSKELLAKRQEWDESDLIEIGEKNKK